jgi:hypothetical protein
MAIDTFSTSDRCLGAWRLGAGEALALHPREASRFVVICGRAWVTLGDGLDHVLTAGASLPVPAGARVVAEAWGEAVAFDWRAQPALAPLPVAPAGFARRVGTPARELGRAVGQAGLAAGHLALGLVAWLRCDAWRWRRVASS